MGTIKYRNLEKDDYEQIKQLINNAFNINGFIKDKKVLDLVLKFYLQDCIVSSSFSKVAEKDNKVIGIILGNALKDKHRLKNTYNIISIACTLMKGIFISKVNKKAINVFWKIQKAYNEMFQGKEKNFQGSIELFIVSQESRGLGVGGELLNSLTNYMKSMRVNSIYVFTDSECNYGFYDSKKFKRINEQEIIFEQFKDRLTVYLYEYNYAYLS
ncbi:GNAT family N-acetyltransferase [Psychrobacillus sp. INOP01]|uniref:GNAT family N-acetyltransferase n=1 Tax=Psychrobacillus sp. INOP01 TaxID=2829187 RepID=UPI001BA9BD8C|nr:GNAT family N-acetyltransferase [Psychrobacillus sp. INOP01]QUG43931.1 GNAT family N-acetyltransferase [Psychrobacillus sp. INOP01]